LIVAAIQVNAPSCAYGTAENMLHRAAVRTGDVVLVAGASGGVGSPKQTENRRFIIRSDIAFALLLRLGDQLD
jgi:hypothetical protein